MTLRRAYNLVRFQVEQMVMRGLGHRLALVALVIAGVSVVFGLLASWLVPDLDGVSPSIWWAFLRLTDPGYLGDDQGAMRRFLSTTLTILGYVLFLGALIAIMTEWLQARIQVYARGLTPIVEEGHVVILGWTRQTGDVVRELVTAGGRLRRFLGSRGVSRLRIVILDEDAGSHRVAALRRELGEDWDPGQVWLRSGSPARMEDLDRVDITRASAIIKLAPEPGAAPTDIADAEAFTTLLTVSRALRESPHGEPPLVVGEFRDPDNMRAARELHHGPMELLSTFRYTATLLARCLEHPGMSDVHAELTGRAKRARLYVRGVPALEGRSFAVIARAFDAAIALGIVRGDGTVLINPPASEKTAGGDQLILLAASYENTAPRTQVSSLEVPTPALRHIRTPEPGTRDVLIAGWSSAIPDLLIDLDSIEDQRFNVTSLSLLDPPTRSQQLERRGVALERVELTMVEGDHAEPGVLRNIGPERFDTILFVTRDWSDSMDVPDARSVLGLVHLNDALKTTASRPTLLVQLEDPDTRALLEGLADEFILSARAASFAIAQVALKPELAPVFRSLFGALDAGIAMRACPQFEQGVEVMDFRTLWAAVGRSGEVLIGLRARRSEDDAVALHLNPGWQSRWRPEQIEELVVMTRATPPAPQG